MRNPLSIEAIADWASKQEPDRLYDYTDPHKCALCKYFDSIGLAYRQVGPWSWHSKNKNEHRLEPKLIEALNAAPLTYGALAERLR